MSIAMNSIFPSTVWKPTNTLAVPAAFMEAEIHDGMTQSEAVAIAHLEVAVGAVGRVRGVTAMWKVGMPAM